jgi:hypothetical protein
MLSLKFFQCSQQKQILFLNFLVLPLFWPSHIIWLIFTNIRDKSATSLFRVEECNLHSDIREASNLFYGMHPLVYLLDYIFHRSVYTTTFIIKQNIHTVLTFVFYFA